MRRAPLAFVTLLALVACGGSRNKAQSVASRLDEHAVPKCEMDLKQPLPKAAWKKRQQSLEAIGRAVGAKEFDEPVVLDALAKEVRSISEEGSCMPSYSQKNGAITYSLGCGTVAPAIAARAAKVEKTVQTDGADLLRAASELKACRLVALMVEHQLASAAMGTMKSGAITYSNDFGCSFTNQGPCAAACEKGVAEACTFAVLATKDTAERIRLGDRACQLSLDDTKTPIDQVVVRCAGANVHTKGDENQRLATRIHDRVCTTRPEAPVCFTFLEPKSPNYEPARARALAARVTCAGDAPCPLGAMLLTDAAHYDAARAARLVAALDDACKRGERVCFDRAAAVRWSAFPPDMRARVAKAVTEECERRGPSAATACGAALTEQSRGGAVEDLERARALAIRLCDESEHMCGLTGECLAKGSCAPAPDPVAGRTYFQRACDAALKVDATKPRGDVYPCKRADELGAVK